MTGIPGGLPAVVSGHWRRDFWKGFKPSDAKPFDGQGPCTREGSHSTGDLMALAVSEQASHQTFPMPVTMSKTPNAATTTAGMAWLRAPIQLFSRSTTASVFAGVAR